MIISYLRHTKQALMIAHSIDSEWLGQETQFPIQGRVDAVISKVGILTGDDDDDRYDTTKETRTEIETVFVVTYSFVDGLIFHKYKTQTKKSIEEKFSILIRMLDDRKANALRELHDTCNVLLFLSPFLDTFPTPYAAYVTGLEGYGNQTKIFHG